MRTMHAATQDTVIPFSLIRTLTVGAGFTPALLTPSSGAIPADGRSRAHARSAFTAGGEFHPAPRTRHTPHACGR